MRVSEGDRYKERWREIVDIFIKIYIGKRRYVKLRAFTNPPPE